MASVQASTTVNLDQLASDIVTDWNLTDDDIVNFIKQIDENAGDWSFTNKVYTYFKKEMKKARKDGWTND